MASEIRAGIRLGLNDQFSPGIRRAGVAVGEFGRSAAGVAGSVNKAFGGLAGTLATVGIGIGAAALIKEGINFRDEVTRIATSAGVFGEEAERFGDRMLEVAGDAKIPVQELAAFAKTAAESAVSLSDITENMPLMADAIQGLGINGQEAGQILSTFLNRGADADTLRDKLDRLTVIGDRLGNVALPEFLRFLPSLLEEEGGSIDNIEEMYAAVNMLRTGTDTAAKAALQYKAAMADFASSDVRRAIQAELGFDVRDSDGNLKNFEEIMGVLSEFSERNGGTDNFDKGFRISDTTIKALKQYNSHFERTLENLGDLEDATGSVAKKAEANAGTAKSSLEGLRTALSKFANSALMGPIEHLTKLLNEHPEGLKNAIVGLGVAMTALAGLKAFTTIATFAGSLKSMKGGGGLGGGLAQGGAGIPVYVTNLGPGLGRSFKPRGKTSRPSRPAPPNTSAGRRPKRPTGRASGSNGTANLSKRARESLRLTRPGITPAAAPTPAMPKVGSTVTATAGRAGLGAAGRLAGGPGIAVALTAVEAIPAMRAELAEIKENTDLSDRERGEAKGGAIGEATGKIVGSAGGAVAGGVAAAILTSALAGTAIGTAVPGLGNIAGFIVGAGVGLGGYYLGGRLGRAAGAGIGGAAAGGGESPVAYPSTAYQGNNPAARGTIMSLSANPYQVNDLIVTPGGTFSTHPADYIMAMKNPAALAGTQARLPEGVRDEIRTVEHVIKEVPPVTVEGEIVLRSDLFIDEGKYRLRQSVQKNTTPYKFAVGSAAEARAIQ